MKTFTFGFIVGLFCLMFGGTLTEAASPGALDLTFNKTGAVSFELGAGNWQETQSVTVQPDGKVLVAVLKGNAAQVNFDFVLLRYNADGTRDTSFGTNGIVTTDFIGEVDVPTKVIVQPDGKILVGGSTEGYGTTPAPTAFKIARYNSNGSLDTSFGASGRVYSGFLNYAVRSAKFALQADGKIIAAGDDGNTNTLISRFNADGNIDSSFGTGGQVTLPDSATVTSIALQSNGKILTTGISAVGSESFAAYRFNTNGTLDTSFAANGKFVKNFTIGLSFAKVNRPQIEVFPDDKILISGTFFFPGSGEMTNGKPPLIKLNPNGDLDASFVPNSTLTENVYNLGVSITSKALISPTDNKIYLVGIYGSSSSFYKGLTISRYNANGTIDNSFGYKGARFVRKVDGIYSVKDAFLQSNGKIVIGATGTIDGLETGQYSANYLLLRVNTTVTPPSKRGDFDGDGKTDFAVFRPSDRFWYVLNSADYSFTPTYYGLATDDILPGDYNYDGKTDYAVARISGSSTQWWIKSSQPGNGVYSASFPTSGTVRIVGDYDGDGLTDLSSQNPNGAWYLGFSSFNLKTLYSFGQPFGQPGDKPVPGDYDGDGRDDVAVFRAGTWQILRSSDNQTASVSWGLAADKPVQADYDGDGKTDAAVYRQGIWYVLKSSDGLYTIMQWGLAEDIPVPGDYDGDGKTDFGVFRPSDGNWYVFKSSDAGYIIIHWGKADDIPIPAKYLP